MDQLVQKISNVIEEQEPEREQEQEQQQEQEQEQRLIDTLLPGILKAMVLTLKGPLGLEPENQ